VQSPASASRLLVEQHLPEQHLIEQHGDALLRWSALWGLPGLESRVRIEVSGRLTRSLGRCEPAKGEIRIARWLWEEGQELLPEVLCHELAHVAAYELHAAEQEGAGSATLLAGVWRRLAGGRRLPGPQRRADASPSARLRPHGREWKSLMSEAGFEPRARIPEAELPAAARARTAAGSRWEHACPACDLRHIARRHMPRWRCRACREAGRTGELVVVKL